MIIKKVSGVKEALKGLENDMTLMLGGFGVCGIPENCIEEIVQMGIKNMTCISNDTGVADFGIGKFINSGQIKKMVASYVGENATFGKLMFEGKIEAELIPQGTLAERCLCAQKGIPAFYTPAGYGTEVEEGKEIKEFDGKKYLMEKAFKADFSLVKAWKGDEAGNLIFRGSARNFNPCMCGAAKITVAEVEELVPVGTLDPNFVHIPGVLVQRIFQGEKFEKRIEQRTVTPRE